MPLSNVISLGLFYVVFFCHFIFHSFTKNLKCFPVNIKNPLVPLASNVTIELFLHLSVVQYRGIAKSYPLSLQTWEWKTYINIEV